MISADVSGATSTAGNWNYGTTTTTVKVTLPQRWKVTWKAPNGEIRKKIWQKKDEADLAKAIAENFPAVGTLLKIKRMEDADIGKLIAQAMEQQKRQIGL